MRKARNRLLFAVPSARLLETLSLPKIGGVIICGEHWVPEQVYSWGETDFRLKDVRTKGNLDGAKWNPVLVQMVKLGLGVE